VAQSAEPDPYPRRRDTVAAFLSARSTVLGDLYRHAGAMLEDRRPEGWQHLVAHVGRELMNRLADHLAEVPVGDPDAPSSPTRPAQIAERLSEALTGDEAALREAAQELIDQIERGGAVTRLRAASLVAQAEEGAGTDPGPTEAWVRAWRDLQQRFAGWAHLRGPPAEAIPADEVDGAWRELTDLLATRVALEPFFASMDELLEIARRPAPDRETARAALARLRPGTKARFYAELEDPAWVGLLAAEGMFSAPPAAIREGDFMRFQEWPEGLVLLRFASTAPEEVARAAAGVPESDNARVAQLLANVSSQLPGELAADSGLAARVVRDLGGTARLLDVAEPAGNLARRLAEAGRTGKALDVLKALLRIDVRTTPSGSDLLPDWKHGSFRHDEYLVDRSSRAMLDALVDGDAHATVKALIRVLGGAQRRLANTDSTRWRDDVADTRSPYGNDPRHLMLELLRDASRSLARRGAEERGWVLDELERQDSEIFKRLRLHLLAVVPDEAARRAAALDDPDVLFSRERLGEVYRLLPVVYAEADHERRFALLARIEAGPDPGRYGLPTAELDEHAEEIERWQDEWRQRLLSALEEQLDGDAQQRLQELRQWRGQIDRPGFAGVRSTSWIGPTSPKGAEQLAAMERDELIALMRDFRAERHFAAPSPEGLGSELARAVEADPQRWTWLAERLPEIPPLYARSWLSGLNGVLRSGALLTDAAQILTAAAWVLEQRADPASQGGPLEDDVDFYGAQLAAADVLIGLLRGDMLAIGDREHVWALIERLTSNPDPTPEREASTEAEPLQLSFVTLRARGAIALLRYLQWLDRRLPDGERPGQRGFAAAPETRGALERLVDDDPSRAVRAALAAELPLLAALDREWLADRITDLAAPDGDQLAQVGWTTYLRYAAIWDNVTSLLADAYRRAVAALADPTALDEEDRRQLGDHVAIIWRDLPDTVAGLLDELLSVGTDEDRARVIATLGRALHPEGPSDYQPTAHDLDRHRTLWDSRLADDPGPNELHEFGWWWSSGRFRAADDLHRLTATLTAASGHIGDVRDALALVRDLLSNNAALTGPVVELLEALARARTAQSQYLTPELLSDLLHPALEHGDLRDRAVELVHRFGEQGYLTLRALLD
jgi:hypothetical protein